MALLEVSGLTKNFGGLVAVNDLSFSIEPGEILAMIGPNGAGKTTVFNLVAGFLKPNKGRITFDGKDITGMSAHKVCRTGIARTFQIVKPFGNMTVLENVMVGAFCRTPDVADARQAAHEIVTRVGLGHKADVPAKTLTTPDRKRLEVARALATRPSLLMLDEAMAGLNPSEVTEVVQLLKRVRDGGVTLFVIEHVMQAVMSLSDRIVLIHHGQKIAEGTPQEVSSDERAIQAYLGEGYRKYA